MWVLLTGLGDIEQMLSHVRKFDIHRLSSVGGIYRWPPCELEVGIPIMSKLNVVRR